MEETLDSEAPMLGLPNELLLDVAGRLSLHDLATFRLVNRHCCSVGRAMLEKYLGSDPTRYHSSVS